MKAADVMGKNVVLTGTFQEFKRSEAEAALSAIGANVSGSVSSKTDMLFVGEKAGSKLAKAKSLKIPVHDEATLAALLAGVEVEAPEAVDVAPIKETPVSAFAGKTVVLTGTFVTMKRSEAEKVMKEAGANVSGSVSKKTDILIHGDNAGSKLTKAQTLGVTLMTELEMVDALKAGGAGAAELEGADKLLKKAAAEKAKNETEMTAVAAELRLFVANLKKRPDIRVTVAKLGRKASKADVDYVRGLVPELADFFAEMNGAHVEWEFAEPSGGGCLRIPAVSQWTKFTGEDEHWMGFGDDQQAMLLDEITAEGNTWLVRDKKGKKGRPVRIIFASAAEGSEGVVPAGSIAEYIRKAMESGFGHYWPRCFTTSPYVSYAEQEQAVTRFRGPVVKPLPVKKGSRVQFGFFSEGGRGEVLRLHTAPDGSHTSYSGNDFVLVQFDEGTVGWLPTRWVKVLQRNDAYEMLRDPNYKLATATKSDLYKSLDLLAHAIGPMGHYSAGMPSNARRAAGVLGLRSLADATKLVADLNVAVIKAKLEGARNCELVDPDLTFDAIDYARFGHKYTVEGVFIGLYAGLQIMAQHQSMEASKPASLLVDADIVNTLPKNADALATVLKSKEVLNAPSYFSGDKKAELKLPVDAPLFNATGY